MYHRVRKKMFHVLGAILILSFPLSTLSKSTETTTDIPNADDEVIENNIIDFDEEYTVKFNKKYGMVPWHANEFNKNSHKYTIVRGANKYSDKIDDKHDNYNVKAKNESKINVESTTEDMRVIPLELLSTTQDPIISIIESTTEQDLTVIPLSTTEKINVQIDQTVTLPTTENLATEFDITTETNEDTTHIILSERNTSRITEKVKRQNITKAHNSTEKLGQIKLEKRNKSNVNHTQQNRSLKQPRIRIESNKTAENSTEVNSTTDNSREENVPIFTELDTEVFEDIPEDYYDHKDVVPTSAPKTDALSVLFGLAGSVVESVVETVAERVVPKSIYDLFKRMQRQNEALEAERLRSREENGGLGQFGRGILKTISTGFSQPLTKLMESKENGSLDTDRGFVSSVASSVSSVANVANSVVDAFKDKVQAIYPGTVWCGDGHSAQARSSSDLGLFFFTDTCCRQHDACKIYIRAGDTKYDLTNTGLFTRSHCSCDTKFRECLRRTNSLVSAQIGLTYFNVLGPQCFRRAHPIVKCLKKTRITGLKCEEYELDYTKPKMWQWFDNETF